jgi:hypothetical protein
VGETAHPKIGIWKHRPADLGHLAEDIARLIDAADSSSAAALRALLQQLVPEYTPDNGGDDSKPQVHPLGFGRAPVVGPTAPSAHRQ